MSSNFTSGMDEATRLTRAGRLAEATNLIQRLLSPGGGAADPVADQPSAEAARPTQKRTGLRETIRRLVERARAAELREPAPPPPIATGARFEAATFANGVGARDYRLYVPASAAGAGPRPLLLMLHGCTQTPEDFALGTGMNAAAEEFGVIVAYPGQPTAANPKRCWNWFRREDQAGERGEAAILAGLVRSVMAQEDVDSSRVFVAGLSAGGAAAANLGAAHPDLFAAVGVHSGLPAGAAQDMAAAFGAMRNGGRAGAPARPMRMIVFHGDADSVVNPANAAALTAQATSTASPMVVQDERGSAGGRDYSREIHIDASGRAHCERWMIHGGGHGWSGGDAGGSFADAAGPDASREMLRFFLDG